MSIQTIRSLSRGFIWLSVGLLVINVFALVVNIVTADWRWAALNVLAIGLNIFTIWISHKNIRQIDETDRWS